MIDIQTAKTMSEKAAKQRQEEKNSLQQKFVDGCQLLFNSWNLEKKIDECILLESAKEYGHIRIQTSIDFDSDNLIIQINNFSTKVDISNLLQLYAEWQEQNLFNYRQIDRAKKQICTDAMHHIYCTVLAHIVKQAIILAIILITKAITGMNVQFDGSHLCRSYKSPCVNRGFLILYTCEVEEQIVLVNNSLRNSVFCPKIVTLN